MSATGRSRSELLHRLSDNVQETVRIVEHLRRIDDSRNWPQAKKVQERFRLIVEADLQEAKQREGELVV